MISDEGGYAYVAYFMSPDYQLYRDIPFYRPQAIFYLYRFIFATIGTDVVAIRLFAALWNAATVVGVYYLGLAVSSRRTAVAAAVLFAVFSAGPSMEGFTANAEIFAQLPIVLCALFAWKRSWALAGIMAGLAVLLKPSGVAAFVLALSWAFATGSSFAGGARVVAAFGLTLVPSVLHGAWIGWDHYWESIVRRRAAYATEGTFSAAEQLRLFVNGAMFSIPSWAIPAVLAIASVVAKIERPQRFAILWLAASLVGMAMGGFWFAHYFIQALPPLALLAALGIPGVVRRQKRWIWAAPIVIATVLFVRDASLWTRTPEQISWNLYHRPGYLVAAEVATYVAANTGETDSIFVAFSEAEIYYLARRRASFPHMYYADFVYSAHLFEGAINTIRQAVPAMVLVAQAPPPDRMSWEEFMSILTQRYEQVRALPPGLDENGPVMIFRRKPTT
jgi:4-amino-4-deoxy-L-arabinose transferase-like glycosyltransferase